MLAGMLIQYEGQAHQVASIQTSAISGPGGIPDPCELYGIQRPGETARRYVKNYTDTQARKHGLKPCGIKVLPACPSCGGDPRPGWKGTAGWPCAEGCTVGLDARVQP